MLNDVSVADIVILIALIAVLLAILSLARHIRGLTDALGGQNRRLQEQLARQRDDVTAVARELLNPLAAIGYAARVLHEGRAGIDRPSLARGIAAEAAGARDLVTGLTEAARAEAHTLRLKLRPTDLAGVVRDTLAAFDPGPQHTIALTIAASDLTVRGDAGALAKVVRHLLSNAVAYAHAGTVRVEISREPNGHEAIVSVRDDGPGIPEGERPLLFRKFSRLSTAGGTLGAGLGLYISRAIVEEHGGAISAEWPSDGGSRFWFTVPLASST